MISDDRTDGKPGFMIFQLSIKPRRRRIHDEDTVSFIFTWEDKAGGGNNVTRQRFLI